MKPKTPSAPVYQALTATQIIAKLTLLPSWKLSGDGADVAIEKTFHLPGFLETMAFVNAVAYIAQRRNHHPELRVSFNRCSVRWNTHDVQGISMADFDCAAQVDALVNPE